MRANDPSQSGIPTNSGRTVSGLVMLLSVIVLLVGLGILGYVVIDRMNRFEDRLIEVGLQAQEATRRTVAAAEAAALAVEQAEAAEARASEAEQMATEAARGRDRAEGEAAEALVQAGVATEEAERARAELDRVDRERQAELDRLERALGEIVETRRTALGLVMSLGSESIEFEFDRATLGASERELLSRIAGVLLTSGDFSVYVYGHTDDVGSEAYNQVLSERRAQSVRDYLVEAGIDPEIIETTGYGKSSPRFSESTPEARSKNRRVEIGIVDVTFDYTDPGQ